MVGAGVDIVLRCMWDRELNVLNVHPLLYLSLEIGSSEGFFVRY